MTLLPFSVSPFFGHSPGKILVSGIACMHTLHTVKAFIFIGWLALGKTSGGCADENINK